MRDDVLPVSGRRRNRRHRDALNAVFEGVAVAVPVGDHDRQPRRHRLHRGQAEGLLDVVGQRGEQVGRRPGPAADLRIASVHDMHRDVGAGLPRQRLDLFAFAVRLEPAGEDQGDVAPGRPGCRLQPQEHGQRMGLRGRGDPAEKQRRDRVLPDTVFAPKRGTCVRVRREGAGIYAQRDHRQLQTGGGRSIAAEARAQIVAPFAEDVRQGVVHRLRGTDDRIPALQGCDREAADGFHDGVAGGRMGDAAQAPGALVVGTSQPRLICDGRARVEQAAGLRQPFRRVERNPAGAAQRPRPFGRCAPCRLAELFRRCAIRRHAHEVAAAGVARVAGEETGAGRLPSHQARARHRVSVRPVIDHDISHSFRGFGGIARALFGRICRHVDGSLRRWDRSWRSRMPVDPSRAM